MEKWDAYDKDLNRLENITLERGADIPEGVYHLVCDVIVRHRDGTWLIMKRDPDKSCGGMWEATAGGSALAGESPVECAARELEEETGITGFRLRELGRVCDGMHTVYVEFLCLTDCEKDKIKLQPGETADFRWVETEELAGMKKDALLTDRMQSFISELSPVTVRLAREGDAPLLADVRVRQLLDEGCRMLYDTRADMEDFFRRKIADGSYMQYIMEKDGELICTAGVMLQEYPPSISWLGAERGYIASVYTVPEHRHRGHASRLLRMIQNDAREKKLGNLWLLSSRDGRGVYKALGFDDVRPGRDVYMEWCE